MRYWICIIMAVLLASCKTPKVVELRTDTVYISKTDTLMITKEKVVRDTVKESITTIIREDCEGNPKERIVYRDVYHSVYNHDSVDYYKSLCDSLRKKENTVVKEKEERPKGSLKDIALVGAFLALLLCLYKWWVK